MGLFSITPPSEGQNGSKQVFEGCFIMNYLVGGQTRWNKLKFGLSFVRVPDVRNVRQQIFAEMLPDMEKFSFNTRDVLCSVRGNQYLPIDNEKEKCYLRFFLHRTFF